MKVAYLSDAVFTASEGSLMLKEHFGPRNVMPVTIDELSYTDLSGDDLLFLPGIPGERSPYPKILTPHVQTRLMRELDRGLIIWTDCAATYEMMAKMKFRTSEGQVLNRRGTGWIDGFAHGPVEGNALPSAPDNRFQHVTLRQVFYKVGGEQRMAWSAYGNGPGIRLSPQELANPDVTVIGRYGPDETSPINTVAKKIGKGLLLSLGVLIQISPRHASVREDARYDAETLASRLHMHTHLTQHDLSRRAYLEHLLGIVRAHYEQLKQAESQDFSQASGIFSPALVKMPA